MKFEYVAKADWYGVVGPMMSILSGFKYRFDEIRVGRKRMVLGKRDGEVAGEKEDVLFDLEKHGLGDKYYGLNQIATFPPKVKSSMT